MTSLRFAAVMLAAAMVGGCAETKYVMKFDVEQAAANGARVWPASPETPRYRYVGQLTGEENFIAEDGKRSAGVKFFNWLVGLVGGEEEKIVLKRPQTGMVDTEGRIYVTDVSNHAVFVFDQPAGKLHVWSFAQERRGFVTPVGIALGKGGQVLVADAELGAVYRLDREGRPLGGFGQGMLDRPTGIARDPQRGRIYVADTHAHDIKVFDDEGRLVQTLGKRGEGEGELNFPTHLAFAGERLYVTDGMNARVQIFDAAGKFVRSLGRRGLYYGNLTRPKGVTVDLAGNIYVVESYYDNLLVFNSEGRFLMPIGGTGRDIGQFYLPAGAWTDRQGRIYVADMFNGRIAIFQFLGGT